MLHKAKDFFSKALATPVSKATITAMFVAGSFIACNNNSSRTWADQKVIAEKNMTTAERRDSARTLLDSAYASLQKGDTLKAEKWIGSAFRLDQKETEAYFYLVKAEEAEDAAMKWGAPKHEEAANWYTRAINLDSTLHSNKAHEHSIYLARAWSYWNAASSTDSTKKNAARMKAAAAFKQAVKHATSRVDALEAREGLISMLYSLGKYSEAIAACNELVDVASRADTSAVKIRSISDPYSDAYKYMAHSYYQLGDIEKALEACDKGCKHDSGFYVLKARILDSVGRTAEAIAILNAHFR